jgi:hypothetical protein
VLDDLIIVPVSRRSRAEARRVAEVNFAVKCCVVCGMTAPSALEVQHLDFNCDNNEPGNLAYLCRTHVAMYDAGLYTREIIEALRAMWQRTKGLSRDPRTTARDPEAA